MTSQSFLQVDSSLQVLFLGEAAAEIQSPPAFTLHSYRYYYLLLPGTNLICISLHQTAVAYASAAAPGIHSSSSSSASASIPMYARLRS